MRTALTLLAMCDVSEWDFPGGCIEAPRRGIHPTAMTRWARRRPGSGIVHARTTRRRHPTRRGLPLAGELGAARQVTRDASRHVRMHPRAAARVDLELIQDELPQVHRAAPR